MGIVEGPEALGFALPEVETTADLTQLLLLIRIIRDKFFKGAQGVLACGLAPVIAFEKAEVAPDKIAPQTGVLVDDGFEADIGLGDHFIRVVYPAGVFQ